MRPTELPVFLDEMAALETDEVSQARLRWHAGLGDGRVRAIGRAPVYHREAVRALERMRQRAENLGGSLIVEKAPLELINDSLEFARKAALPRTGSVVKPQPVALALGKKTAAA